MSDAPIDDVTVMEGSGDALADLGFSAEHRLKAGLVTRLRSAFEERGLSQSQGAKIVSISQPELSRLFRGQFSDISAARLMSALTKLDLEVAVTVRRRGEASVETIHYSRA